MTTTTMLTWNKKRDGKGYWAVSPAGDELVIWKMDEGGWVLNVRGEVPFNGRLLQSAKQAAEAWVEAHLPQVAPATAGAWSIDDAGNLWKDGEYIGRIAEDHRPGSTGRSFYAQGVVVEDPTERWGDRRHLSIGGSSARTITTDDHAALSAKVAS